VTELLNARNRTRETHSDELNTPSRVTPRSEHKIVAIIAADLIRTIANLRRRGLRQGATGPGLIRNTPGRPGARWRMFPRRCAEHDGVTLDTGSADSFRRREHVARTGKIV